MNKQSLAAVCAALLLAAGPAAALDVKMVLPLAPALAQPHTQQALGGLKVAFGAPPPEQRAPLAADAELRVYAFARHTDTRTFSNGQQMDGRQVLLNNEQICQLALRYALRDLAEAARERKVTSVVNLVSWYYRTELNSTSEFECHVHAAHASVELRGRPAD